LLLLHALCEWQFEDIDHFRSKIKLEDGEDESDWVLKKKKKTNTQRTACSFGLGRVELEGYPARNRQQVEHLLDV